MPKSNYSLMSDENSESSEDSGSADYERFRRKFSYHSEDSEFWIWNNRADFSDHFVDDESEGYDHREDEEKEECAEAYKERVEFLVENIDDEYLHAAIDYSSMQFSAKQTFASKEKMSINGRGKIISYSQTKFNSFEEIGEPITLQSEIDMNHVTIADQIFSEVSDNRKLFTGNSEMRCRIDIDSVIRLVFKNFDGVRVEIEGEGITAAGGNIDYIVSVDNKRVGVIEAKRDDKTMELGMQQLYHEMMAIVNLDEQVFSPSHVFGFLTDGASWTLHLSNYKTVHCCGHFSTRTRVDIAELVAVLCNVVTNLSSTCNDIFYSPYEGERVGPLISKWNHATEELEYNLP